MAYDEELAERIRDALKRRRGVTERKMFGGIAFMVNGNMSVGVVKKDLMVRVGKDAAEAALALPHARPMDFTGKPMKGMVYVGAKALNDETILRDWIDRGVKFARSLPNK